MPVIVRDLDDHHGGQQIYNNQAVDGSTFAANGEIIETYVAFENMVIRCMWTKSLKR